MKHIALLCALAIPACVVNRDSLAPQHEQTADAGKLSGGHWQGENLAPVVRLKPRHDAGTDAAAEADAAEFDPQDAAPDAQPLAEPDAVEPDAHVNLAPTAQPDYLYECGAMNDTGVYRYTRRVMHDEQFVGCSLKNAEIDQSVEWPQLDPKCHILDYTITESEATNATGVRLVVMQCMCTSGKCTEP